MPLLAILAAEQPGQGKTRAVEDLVVELRRHKWVVGGFSIRRAYNDPAGSQPVAFYGHLWQTDTLVRLSHAHLRGDEKVNLEGFRVVKGQLGSQEIVYAETKRLLDHLEQDTANPAVSALVIDAIDPVLTATSKQGKQRAQRLPDLVKQALEALKPLVVVCVSELDQYISSRRAIAALEEASALFPGTVLRFDFNRSPLPEMGPLVLRTLEEAGLWKANEPANQ